MDGFKFRALEFNIRLDSIDWSLVEMCALSANLVFILHGKKINKFTFHQIIPEVLKLCYSWLSWCGVHMFSFSVLSSCLYFAS